MFKKTTLSAAILATIGMSGMALAGTGLPYHNRSISPVVGTNPAVIPVAAHATTNPILVANSEIGIGIVDTQSNYSENIVSAFSGSDVENGLIPGFTLFGKDTFNAFGVKHWYVSFSYTRTSGQTTYSLGSARNGQFSESAQHATNNLQTKFGKTYFLGNANNAITPYIFGGYRTWHRVVPGGVSSPENYHNEYIGLGAKYQIAVTRHLVLSANSGVGEVIGAGMSGTMPPAYTHLFNMPSTVKFSLASRPYYTMGIGADYRVTKHLHMLATAQYTDFMYGGSQWNYYSGNQPATRGYVIGFREPSSQTSNLSVGLAMAYQF
jgi:hypothetical protein